MLFHVMFILGVGREVFNSHIFYHYSLKKNSKSRHQFDCQQMLLYLYFRHWKYVLEFFLLFHVELLSYSLIIFFFLIILIISSVLNKLNMFWIISVTYTFTSNGI